MVRLPKATECWDGAGGVLTWYNCVQTYREPQMLLNYILHLLGLPVLRCRGPAPAKTIVLAHAKSV